MAVAKRKLAIPTLVERVDAIGQEVDDELDRLAEVHRPSNVPGPSLRRMWLAKAAGNKFEALKVALKELGL